MQKEDNALEADEVLAETLKLLIHEDCLELSLLTDLINAIYRLAEVNLHHLT